MKKYSYKWLTQRITATLLVPLSFWFIYHCISFQNFSYKKIFIFFNSYFNAVLFLILMVLILIHSKLGCETVVEDYISSDSHKKSIIWIIRLFTYVAILISVVSVGSIVF